MNIFSFFSGSGFLDLGFELEGHYKIVFVNEFHKAFNHVYQFARSRMGIPQPLYGHHVENVLHYVDGEHPEKLEKLIQMVEDSRKKDITGFIGGPPCPDCSIAGSNKGKEGENGRLSGTYCELICRVRPDFFLFENVKGLYRTARHRAFFEQLKDQFRENGYSLTERLINSLEYGVPQDRDRIILIGFSQEISDRFHLQTHGGTLEAFQWNAYKRYDINEIKSMPWPTTNPYQENVQTDIPTGIHEKLTIMYWWRNNDVEHHPNADMFFKPRAGIYRFQTKDEGDMERKCYKRLHRWRYSPTAAYGNNEVHIHPYLPRRISVSEALAIQSLPAEFVIPKDISLSDAFKTIGNGVPYLAAHGIAKTIWYYLNSQ